MNDVSDPLSHSLVWHDAGHSACLAIVVETWGSAPRPVGSLMAISEQAELVGSVSGGCVEGAVVAEALELMAGGAPKILEYGVSDDDAFAVGLACGGQIKILVLPVSGAGGIYPSLHHIERMRREKQPVAHVIDVATGAGKVAVPPEFSQRFQRDESGFEDENTFVVIHNPPLRLYVIGGVHIAQALVPMAKIAGYDVTVIDPREAFASAARFPDTDLHVDWPDSALQSLGIDARTAVVTLTHDAKIDDMALATALTSEAFYIGCLGSTRTHAKRITRLTENGITAEQTARLHAPIGLDIGARTPAEIAVAVLAEITAALRRSP